MKKILLTHSYFLAFDPKQKKLGQPYAPLATLYAAAVLREQQYTVQIFDVMFESDPAVVETVINEFQPDIFVIYDDGFNYLTKMCLTNMRKAAYTMTSIAKRKGLKVIISSSDATDHYHDYLEAGADFIIAGEAEQTLVELVDKISNNDPDFAPVAGLIYNPGDHPVKTAARPVMKDLDKLPLPAWDLIDIKPYYQSWMGSAGYFSINLTTTRGCPYKCNWCAKPIYGNRYNSRSPAHVVKELKLLKERFHYDHVWFCDDIFGLKPGWVTEFARLVSMEQLNLKFKIQARADLLSGEDYVASLAKAGCVEVWMGAESGSQKILDAMDKGITIRQVEKATALLKKYGIKPCFFIQFGYPGENREDIGLTISMIKKLLPADIGISVSYPLPGTKFYEKVKNELVNKANWTDSDDLDMMFSNTFHPAYYKHLHRYVHKIYRRQLAKEKLMQIIRAPFRSDLASWKKIFSGLYYGLASLKELIILKQMEKA